MVEIHYKTLRLIAIVILVIPAILFFVFWLKPIFSVLLAGLLMASVWFAGKSEDKVIRVNKSHLIVITVIVLLWLILLGQGGFFSQKQDHEIRNVIMRDLINYRWPVRYQTGNDESLVYYIGYWLLPSIVGKVFKAIGGFDVGWLAARITLLICSFVYVFTAILLILFKIERITMKKVAILLGVFIFFSGMDAIGEIGNPDYSFHIEWWSGEFQYSSMTTQLGWVYNQAIPVWLCMSLVLNEKDEKSYGLIGLSLLPTSPLPLIGVASYMIWIALTDLVNSVKSGCIREFWKRIFTMSNILPVISIVPVFWFYYNNNVASSVITGETVSAGSFNYLEYFVLYGLFIVLEFGLLLFLMRNEFRKSELIFVLASLLLIPLIHFGNSIDFCMRVSIPVLYIVMIRLITYLSKDKHEDKVRLVLITIIFAIGVITPMVELRESIGRFIDSKGHSVSQYDYLTSLEELPIEYKPNFVGVDSSHTIFFKYLANLSK